MREICVYCLEDRKDKIGCCGENHWEEVDDEEEEIQAQVYDPPMTQTEEYLLRKQGLQDFNDYWHSLD